jgi:hypothetical protein
MSTRKNDKNKDITFTPDIISSEVDEDTDAIALENIPQNEAIRDEGVEAAENAEYEGVEAAENAEFPSDLQSIPGAFPSSQLNLDFQNPGPYWSAPLSSSRRSGRFIRTIALNAMHRAAETKIPRNIREARESPEWHHWEEAMKNEFEGLTKLKVFDELDKTAVEKNNVISGKWVFDLKKDAKGNIVRYKARLVAKGFSQTKGYNYFDTYAPVAKIESVKLLLSIAAINDLEICQTDVKQAFCFPDLKETIYMNPPHIPGRRECVWKLKKSLYGLKQAARYWNKDKVSIKSCEE